MEEKKFRGHVVVLPYPSQGHINPLLQFAKRLASKGVKATLATTRCTFQSIRAANVGVEPISDGFDEGGFAQARNEELYLKSFKTNGSRTLSELIQKFQDSSSPVSCVVYDSCLPWALDVAKQHGIFGASFFTNSATVCNIFCRLHYGLLSLPVKLENSPLLLPGLPPPLNFPDLPSFLKQPESYPAYLAMKLSEAREVRTTGKIVTDPSCSSATKSAFQTISISGEAEVHHNLEGGRETQQYYISVSATLVWRIVMSSIFMIAAYIPVSKDVLDKKVINALTVGMIVRGVMCALVQFITGSELYTGAYEALRVGVANTDVLIVSGTTVSYFYSVYSSLRAAFSKDFKDTDFFATNSMFITFILLRKSLKVIGGTQDENGVLPINVTPAESGSAVLRIVGPAESLQMDEVPAQKFADGISKYFVPLVIIISFSTWFAWFLVGMLHGYPKSWVPSSMGDFELALQFGISITLVVCSCAPELATPITAMVTNGIAEFQGSLIKRVQALETAHKVDRIIFGKRGILTTPVVDDVKLLTNMGLQEFLFLIAAIEMKSEHPIATAIVDYVKKFTIDKENPAWPEAEAFESFAGHGVEGKVQNKEIIVGNHRLMSQKGIDIPSNARNELSKAEEMSQTGILVSIDGEVAGVFVIFDQVKPGTREVITTLTSMNIRTIMVTGDNQMIAEFIANKVGIKTVVADATLEDRAKKVKELQASRYTVAMVGQDINDSPALKAADVGIAIGVNANEAADIVLKKLEDVITTVYLSRKTFPLVRLNRIWALLYTLLAIPVAGGALIPLTGFRSVPLISAAGIISSSVGILFSFHMLKKYKTLRNLDIQELREIKTE